MAAKQFYNVDEALNYLENLDVSSEDQYGSDDFIAGFIARGEIVIVSQRLFKSAEYWNTRSSFFFSGIDPLRTG